MGFDSYITFGMSETMAEDEKNWPFYQPEKGLDIGKFVHLPVLVNQPVKMCLKGDENIAEAGLHNAPQYCNKDDRNG
jgi:hypothetical protein